MKKSFFLALLSLLIFPVIAINQAAGQLVNTPDEMDRATQETWLSSNLSQVEVGQLVARGIQVVLGFLAVIFLALTLVSGFKWMTAGGNEEQVKKAQSTLKSAIIGLLIVLAAYTVTYFIFRVLPFGGSVGGEGVGTSG
jgi:nitrate reductase gamma subunit